MHASTTEIGQFTSVAPLLQTGVGQTLNGYSYAVQNPATVADPSGLGVPECNEPQKYGITCRGGIPVSTGKKKASSSEGPVRACRCGTRPPLVKGMKPTGLGGTPGRRNFTLPSTRAPKGWLKTTPPNPGPAPKAEANKNWYQRAADSFTSTPGGLKKLMGAAFGAMGMDNSRGACASLTTSCTVGRGPAHE